jgi:hypothetical protein
VVTGWKTPPEAFLEWRELFFALVILVPWVRLLYWDCLAMLEGSLEVLFRFEGLKFLFSVTALDKVLLSVCSIVELFSLTGTLPLLVLLSFFCLLT